MTARGLTGATALVAAGGAIAAALFWALLNVPESNVFALGLSAILVFAIVATVGLTLGAATAMADGARLGEAARQAPRALPAFLVSLLLIWLIASATGGVDTWWRAHRGEVDALFLRYAAATRTRGLHLAVAWITWGIRWVIGASIVAALVSAGARKGWRGIPAGLQNAFRVVPLASAAAAVAIGTGVLWRVVYWRPRQLSGGRIDPALAGVKLLLLYLAACALGAIVLRAHARSGLGIRD